MVADVEATEAPPTTRCGRTLFGGAGLRYAAAADRTAKERYATYSLGR